MTKTFFILAIATTLLAGILFNGCQSPAKKEEKAQTDVKNAKQVLNDAQKDANTQAQKTANAEEWRAFKNESETRIRENEIRIAELKDKMKNSGKTLDAIRAKRIDELEEKNKALKNRIDAYDKYQSDWESFKREFNHDMDQLGEAFRDMMVDNKK